MRPSIAPSRGYDFQAKQENYRKPLMDFEDRVLKRIPIADRKHSPMLWIAMRIPKNAPDTPGGKDG